MTILFLKEHHETIIFISLQNRFWRHNGCIVIVAVNEMKAALTETEKNGIKFDKDECQKTVTSFKSRLTKLN